MCFLRVIGSNREQTVNLRVKTLYPGPLCAIIGADSVGACRRGNDKEEHPMTLKRIPVSYTHLDVYKRQCLIFPSFFFHVLHQICKEYRPHICPCSFTHFQWCRYILVLSFVKICHLIIPWSNACLLYTSAFLSSFTNPFQKLNHWKIQKCQTINSK